MAVRQDADAGRRDVAPVATRFRTYAIALEPELAAYCEQIFSWDLLKEWSEGAVAEPDEIIELEVEF